MKRLSLICVAALAPAFAMADITPMGPAVSGNGSPYTWTYSLWLWPGQSAVSGAAPSAPTVANADKTFGSLFTIYDFDGYITGSCAGPVGWACTHQYIGITPGETTTVDNGGILNLTWVYTSGENLSGDPNGRDLGDFTAQSAYNTFTTVSYAGRGTRGIGADATIGVNGGMTIAPSAQGTPIPEPGSLALAGLGLAGLVLIRRRKGT